ncbi:carbonic anhydrase [Pseudomonadota bacterium]
MKMKYVGTVLFATAVTISSQATAAGNLHWGYSGHEGPEHWGSLDDSYATCSSGKNQSPIDLTNMVDGKLPKLTVNYEPGGAEVLNNGHAIQVNYTPGSIMTVGKRSFELKQFHFHSPSENNIEGQSFPMEAHFVHADKNGNLAVIAVMYKAGEANAELEKAWAHMPAKAGGKHTLANILDAKLLLPPDRAYYRFNGSLTTPPCSEGVNWFVMKYFDTASKAQLEKFSRTINQANNRPIQPINARVVIE